MKALVTGGAGLIGSHLVDLLLKKGYKVRIFDNLEKQTHLFGKPSWIPEQAEFIMGDMRNIKDLDSALQDIDIIFHQAAFGGFTPEISKYVDVNSLGTAKLLELIKLKGYAVKKIVVASSQAVYGEGRYSCPAHGVQYPALRTIEQLKQREWEVKCPICSDKLKPLPTDEESKIGTTTVYGLTKYFQERLVLGWGKDNNIPTVALRYSVTFGPRQSIYNPYTGVCSIFSTRILNGLPPVIYEDGNQTRDFIYVHDVARANLFVMENDLADYNVFNVGSGKAVKISDFARILTEKLNRKMNFLIKNEFRIGEVRHLVSDSSRLKALGFQLKYTLEEGIQNYVNWIMKQHDVKEYFTEAENILKKSKIVITT